MILYLALSQNFPEPQTSICFLKYAEKSGRKLISVLVGGQQQIEQRKNKNSKDQMQVPTEHVMQLAQLLEHTLNPDPTVRKNGMLLLLLFLAMIRIRFDLNINTCLYFSFTHSLTHKTIHMYS